ncbi:MAG: cobalamin biosynthesis protein [Zoogloeaceae bacterium]|jgi:cobalamin biosynthesis protein CobD/CbiB|nr:cobalamin biosynthesis protein [Zoogloeaceae bacterium]
MTFFSLILALLLEQRCPLPYARWIARPASAASVWLERRLNAGGGRQGGAAVLIVFLPVLLLVSLVVFLLAPYPFLALAVNVIVLYFTMGFRQFSHFYTDIQLALSLEDTARARDLLSAWKKETDQETPSASASSARPSPTAEGAEFSRSDIVRQAIETALVASHQHVFAVIFWFAVLPGPLGAALYRLAQLLAWNWRGHGEFGVFAARVFWALDWLPARVTAIVFAIVGNFEDAVDAWRQEARRAFSSQTRIVLSSGFGALGIPPSVPAPQGDVSERAGKEHVLGVESMQSAVGLVWRAIALWLSLLLLLGLARLAG